MPRRTVDKTYSITPRDVEMVEEMFKTGKYLSRSEVIRHCIHYAHKKEFPYYKKKARAKEAAMSVWDELKKLPDEEYAVKVLRGDIATSGICRIEHKNLPQSMDIPLGIVKNYASRNDAWKSVGIPAENE